jgi:hypothetical protein
LFPANGTTSRPWVPSVSKSIIVATEFQALLNCSFKLVLTHPAPDKKSDLWSSTFSRAKTFPANNQLGNFGTTSSLINESEFDRALADMARNMMADVHESMLAMF